MAITIEQKCACGSVLSYSGDRAGERMAKAEWEQGHGAHAVSEPVPVAPAPEPVAEAPKLSRRRAREEGG